MMLAPEEVYLKKRTVVSLETRRDAKGRAGKVIYLSSLAQDFMFYLQCSACFWTYFRFR